MTSPKHTGVDGRADVPLPEPQQLPRCLDSCAGIGIRHLPRTFRPDAVIAGMRPSPEVLIEFHERAPHIGLLGSSAMCSTGGRGSGVEAPALLSAVPPIGVVNRLVEGVDEEAGDPLRLLVRDEVAGAGDGDQGCARARFECGTVPLGVSPPSPLSACTTQAGTPNAAESCRWRVVTIEVPQVGNGNPAALSAGRSCGSRRAAQHGARRIAAPASSPCPSSSASLLHGRLPSGPPSQTIARKKLRLVLGTTGLGPSKNDRPAERS